jgi:Uncharacterised nucleotidyltransferase
MRPLDHNLAELLRACARPRTEVSAASFAQLERNISGWQDLIRGAVEHGILPMLYSRLLEIPEAVPSDVLQLARREFERNAFHCMTNAEELLHVLGEFEEAGLAAMPFKGVVLGASAYDDMTMRPAGDIDLLIHYRDLQRATEILKHRGYELKTKTLEDGSPEAKDYFEFHFERESDGMVLELRWKLELTQPRYGYELGLDWLWDRRRSLSLAGAQVPNLDPVSSLLVLCMHGSKHAWSRWMWVCDVAKVIESEPGLDWELTRREAKRVGLERCLALGVLLAWRNAGAEVPQDVRRKLECDRDVSNLADFFTKSILENPGAMPAGRMPYHLRILGFRDRVRMLVSPSILQPNDRDRAAIRLPRALEPLYYVIRPFRVLFDRTAR